MKATQSIALRLTLITVFLLAVCCLTLTFALNFSAYQLAAASPVYIAQAAETQPAQTLEDSTLIPPSVDSTALIAVRASIPAQTYRITSYLTMACLVLLCGALMYFFIWRTLKPLRIVSNQMKTTSADSFPESLPLPKQHDEIYEVTAAFNDMTQKLEDAFAAQKLFSASAAHELRTPLTAMRTKLEVFQKAAQHTPQEYDKLLQTLQKQVLRLQGLVVSLLQFSRGQELPLTDNVSLAQTAKNVCNTLQEAAAAQSVTLHCSELPENALVTGNSELIYQAMHNIVENAIRYNVPNGNLTLEILPQNGWTVRVTDTGIGIPAAQQAAVLQPFYTADASRSRKSGGAGMGLAIVQQIMQRHRGSIAITDNPSGGCIVELRFVADSDQCS